MQLTKAERLVVSRIVNIRLDNATLKDHILLEGIYKAIKPEEVIIKTPLDYVETDQIELFSQYDGEPVNKIENEEHRKIITSAIQQARVEELKMWSNEETPNEVEITDEQAKVLINFIDKDTRPFSREQHAAIVSLHEKLIAE